MRFLSALILCVVFGALIATATPREDELGAGSVSSSLGGAGLASLGEPAATYLNPANLSLCKRSTAEVGVRYIGSFFSANQTSTTPSNVNLLGNVVAGEVGGCIVPLEGFGIGIWASNNVLRPVTLAIDTLDDDIYFARFGDAIGSPTIMAGVGYAFIPWLSLGVSIFIHSTINISQEVFAPLSAAPNPFKANIRAQFSPRAGVLAGLSLRPFDFLELGATFRTENYGALNVDSRTSARYLMDIGPIHVTLAGLYDYSPRQYSFGVTARPISDLSLYVDLNIVQWSLYPGPFDSATPDPASAISVGIQFPPHEDFTFRDVYIPRFGVEYAFAQGLTARVGYSYHPAIVGLPQFTANLVDNDTHQIALGAGYRTQGETVAFKVDGFVGVHLMPQAVVAKSSPYTFGGTALATGFTTGLEF